MCVYKYSLCLDLPRVGPSCGAILDRPPVLKISVRPPWREHPFFSSQEPIEIRGTSSVTPLPGQFGNKFFPA